jgi:hypothetical protein
LPLALIAICPEIKRWFAGRQIDKKRFRPSEKTITITNNSVIDNVREKIHSDQFTHRTTPTTVHLIAMGQELIDLELNPRPTVKMIDRI